MNPCEVCGKRIMPYGGTCNPCLERRHKLAQTQWRPSYLANTARHNAKQGHTPEVHETAAIRDAAQTKKGPR